MRTEQETRARIQACLAAFALVFLWRGIAGTGSAHEVTVHEQITLHAEASALGASQGYSGFINLIMPESGFLVLRFEGRPASPAGCILFYQGTIGVDGGGQPLDPVDAGRAIAPVRFLIGPSWDPCPLCPT